MDHDWPPNQLCCHKTMLRDTGLKLKYLRRAKRNFSTLTDEYTLKKKKLASISAHTSFCAVKVKHPNEVTISKTHLLLMKGGSETTY